MPIAAGGQKNLARKGGKFMAGRNAKRKKRG
jgi:hypothetical protein